jgi:hypothetical protein
MSTQQPILTKGQRKRQKKKLAARKAQIPRTKQLPPPVMKKRLPRKPAQRNALGQTSVQAKGDPRLGKQGIKTSDLVTNAQNAITHIVPLQPTNIWSFALGYVTRALEAGFAAEATNDYDPNFAFIYLINLLLQYSSNGTPPALAMPKVILAVAKSLGMHTVGFGNGKVSYTFSNIPISPPGTVIGIGYFAYGYKWTTGWVVSDPALTNTFPNLTTAGAPIYTDEAGASAFSSMNLFLANNLFKGNIDFAIVKNDVRTLFDNDVSPYAIVSAQQGLGSGSVGSGGFGVQSQMEVPMFRPLLTLMNPLQESVAPITRYPNLTVNVAGDPTVLGAYLGNIIPLHFAGMKRPIKFHPIDFNEFLEVCALWLQGIIQAAMNDQGGQFSEELPVSGYTLPITLQEFGMLLRNTLMDAFKATQAGVQGLYPQIPVSDSDNQFVPLVASAGTCFLQSVPMQLPVPLIENIRSLVSRVTSRSATDHEMFVPVLGVYAQDVISSTDYVYTYNGVEYPVFLPSTSANFKKKVWNEKTNSFETKLLIETPISFVDGGASGIFVAINNNDALRAIQGDYDEWLNLTGVSTFSATLGTLSAENGINVLYSGNMTRHWIPTPITYQSKRSLSVRPSIRSHRALEASPYATRMAFADTAQSQPFSSAYTDVQSVWILPSVQ